MPGKADLVDRIAEVTGIPPDQLRRGLRLQDLGNRVIELLGGRSVHPVGLRVGGFHRLPEPAAVRALAVATTSGSRH